MGPRAGGVGSACDIGGLLSRATGIEEHALDGERQRRHDEPVARSEALRHEGLLACPPADCDLPALETPALTDQEHEPPILNRAGWECYRLTLLTVEVHVDIGTRQEREPALPGLQRVSTPTTGVAVRVWGSSCPSRRKVATRSVTVRERCTTRAGYLPSRRSRGRRAGARQPVR